MLNKKKITFFQGFLQFVIVRNVILPCNYNATYFLRQISHWGCFIWRSEMSLVCPLSIYFIYLFFSVVLAAFALIFEIVKKEKKNFRKSIKCRLDQSASVFSIFFFLKIQNETDDSYRYNIG